MSRYRLSKQTLIFTVVVCLSLLIFVASSIAKTETVKVLTLPDLSNWETEEFSGKTSYELVTIDDRQAIKAISNQSASGLVRKMKVDLTKTPYLNWSWKVDSILNDVNETQKNGDDYAARIYVVISGGIFFWRTRAISYAWASEQPKNTNWPNAFTRNATMVAMESGPELAGQWVTEKRNVLEDIEKLLDIDKTQIDAIAIMTDTDNSKQSATAYYGDIYFTAK